LKNIDLKIQRMGLISLVSNNPDIHVGSFVYLRIKHKQLIENPEKFENHPRMLVV